MNLKQSFFFGGLLVLASSTLGQSSPDNQRLLIDILAKHPRVLAKKADLDAARAHARGRGSAQSMELELAPGLGATNGNLALKQRFDFFGVRGLQARTAQLFAVAEEYDLRETMEQVQHESLRLIADVAARQRELALAKEAVEVTSKTADLARKRLEIGEAAAVHVTRAEIEVQRSRQMVVRATAERDIKVAELSRVSGWAVDRLDGLAWDLIDPQVDANLDVQSRARLLAAKARYEASQAFRDSVRRESMPTVEAGLVSDGWSLNRRPFARDSFGFQVMVAFPLVDFGEQRAARDQAGSQATSAQLRMKEVELLLQLELEAATARWKAARAVLESYSSELEPKAVGMVQAMQKGYSDGVVTFVDVLEAQRALIALRSERLEAERQFHHAQAELIRAAGLKPFQEVKR